MGCSATRILQPPNTLPWGVCWDTCRCMKKIQETNSEMLETWIMIWYLWLRTQETKHLVRQTNSWSSS